MDNNELGTNLASLGTDCISRQTAIDAMAELQGRASSKGELTGISKAWKRIKQLPPIQPKKGKWIKSGRWGRVYKCNQCGNFLDFDGVNTGRGDANFCPNCGADMRQREE